MVANNIAKKKKSGKLQNEKRECLPHLQDKTSLVSTACMKLKIFFNI
jgi:hypothetical protein